LHLRPRAYPHIPEQPNRAELRAAWATLWEPVAEFSYPAHEDRGVTAAALLTAVVRRTLRTAPAFAFSGVPGAGKTRLATCIAEIAGGDAAVVPECRAEPELRKRLLSALRERQSTILIDNIKGQFASTILETFLTNGYCAGWVLGASQMMRIRTNMLTLLCGSTFLPQGGLWRRVLLARLGPGIEHAGFSNFTFDARKYCRENRQQLVAAALTILRGFITAGKRRSTSDRLASFEQWDDLVRQCVLWLDREGIAELGDPHTHSQGRTHAQAAE